MRYLTLRGIGFGLLLTGTGAGALHGQTRADVAARRAIDTANARFVRAYNAGDVATAAKMYASDATVLPANGPAIHGQAAIADWWQGGYKTGVRNLKLMTDELEVHGNSAAEVGRYELDIQPGTGPASHDHGKYIVLWRRNPGGTWQLHRDIYNSDVPASSPSTK